MASPSTIKLSNFPSSSSPSFSFRHKRRRLFAFYSASSPSTTSASGKRSPSTDISKWRLIVSASRRSKNDVTSSSSTGTPISKSLFQVQSLGRRVLSSKKVRSIILLNVVTFIYASSIPVVKEVEAVTDPATFTVVRFVTSAIPFIPFALRARDDVQTRNSGVELGFWVSLGYLMQALGLLTSDAGRASFLSMLTVIVVPLLDGMLGAVVPARTWFGALMSVVGVAMLESSGSPPCIGDLLNFLSAVFFGIHMLRTEQISRETNEENFLPLLGYEVSVVALFSIVWYFLGGWFGNVGEFNPSSWSWIALRDWMFTFPWMPALYTGLLSTGLCLWIEMAAMRDISATETAIIYGLEPVWGGGIAWILLGERWGATGWTGAALVIGGSLMVQIIAASSPRECSEDQKRGKQVELLVVSEAENRFPASPVKIRKDDSNYPNK